MINRKGLVERVEWFPKTASTQFDNGEFVTITSGTLVPAGTTDIPVGIVQTNVPSSDTTTNYIPVDTPFRNDDYIMDASLTLVYTGLTGTFAAGETIVGSTSGAKAIVLTDNGTTTMQIAGVFGAFQVGETITGETSGATATVSTITVINGALIGTYVDIDATSPLYVDVTSTATGQVFVVDILPATTQIVGRLAKTMSVN